MTSWTLDALECDVPVETDVLELLWRARCRINIPETIVYKFGKLESWFFCSNNKKGEPQIRRKRDYTVRRGDVSETITKAFTSQCTSDQDLVATWVSGNPDEPCKVLHLTKDTLHRFLAHMPDKTHGVLQRWVAPFGGRSTLVRTDWSPHYFSLEQCTNWCAFFFLWRFRVPAAAATRSPPPARSPTAARSPALRAGTRSTTAAARWPSASPPSTASCGTCR